MKKLTNNSTEAIDEGKKVLVEEFVKQLKDALELKDDINVVFCPQYTSMGRNALACIEPTTMTMQISIIHFRKMGIEEIKKVVAHEITHKFELEHNPEFERRLNELLSGTWTPTFASGITIIDGNRPVKKYDKPKKKEKPEIDKTRCAYCGNTVRLIQCKHCKDYFCEEHYNPIQPSMPNFNNPNKIAEWKNRENTHPCPAYYTYSIRKEKEQIKKIEKSFNKMSGKVSKDEIKEISAIESNENKVALNFCPECGNKLNDAPNFCSNCGYNLKKYK